MSRLGAKTYSRRDMKSSLQFDQLLSDNKNKPSTAKVSVASVHRWGMASFTSIRKTQLAKEAQGGGASKRKKLAAAKAAAAAAAAAEPMDRGNFCSDDPFSFESDHPSIKKKSERLAPKNVGTLPIPVIPAPRTSLEKKPNKFFKSREVRPLGAQNSPEIESATGKDPKDRKYKDYDTYPKKGDVQENFVAPKAAENIDLLFLQNPDPTEEHSPTHSDNSPLPDYFGSDPTEEPFLQKSPGKRQSPRGYSGEFDSAVRVPSPVRTNSAPHTRTYTRSRRRAEENALSQSSVPSQLDRLPSQYNALPPIRSLSQKLPSSWESKSSTTGDSDIPRTTIRLVPRSWSESVSLDSQATDTSSLQLSQESKGVPSLSDSQQSNNENDHARAQGLKSRRIFNNPKLKKATYKHRPWQVEESADETESSQETAKTIYGDEFEVDEMGRAVIFDGHKLTLSKQIKSSQQSGEAVTSWTCQRKLYTVVHNVKPSYQCHESGETQEFNDDVEYLLEGIQQTSSLGTRCLSTLGWASKCMVPSFRIHVRAHATMSSVYSALADAPKEPSLSLCVATLMFVLSQDRLTMDLEARSLSLMLQLLDTTESLDASLTSSQSQEVPDSQGSICSTTESISAQQHSKVIEKVRHLCEVMKQNGYAKQLDLNNITTGNLAMETLLSMTSRKAGEWFKEEIRSLGGLDYIIDAVQMCVELCSDSSFVLQHPVEEELDVLRKVDRCLRVLENVSFSNSDNQMYLLEYKSSSLLKSCVSLLQVCRGSLVHCPLGLDPQVLPKMTEPSTSSRRKDGPGSVFFSCILSLLKVLINLSNENKHGSKLAGLQDGLMDCILLCILQTPQNVPHDERFDLFVLALGFLINLMEGCEGNRHRFVVLRTVGSYDSHHNGFELSSLEALVQVFVYRCDLARQCEEHTDALLDGQETRDGGPSGSGHSSAQGSHQSRIDEMEETLMKALQKAGKNMEHTMIAAYIALLLGCVIQTQEYADLVRVHLPGQNFKSMVDVLRKFLNFINLTGSISTKGAKSIQRVLDILENS